MNICVIGDIHGKSTWKSIVNKHIDTSDKIVFIGDYFDCFENYTPVTQANNLADILALKRDYMDKVVVLIGNHDYHYLSYVDEVYSGFTAAARPLYSSILEPAIQDGLMQMCYVQDDFLFTHAGVTQTWAEANDIDLNNIEASINDLFKYKPLQFKFTPNKKFRFSGGDVYGDDITQTPIWVRLYSLNIDKVPGYKQIVGHTPQQDFKLYQSDDKDIVCVDWLDSVKMYLTITNGKCRAHKINS